MEALFLARHFELGGSELLSMLRIWTREISFNLYSKLLSLLAVCYRASGHLGLSFSLA